MEAAREDRLNRGARPPILESPRADATHHAGGGQRSPATSTRAPAFALVNRTACEASKPVARGTPRDRVLGRHSVWKVEERDYAADYQRLFGEPADSLLGVSIMTDSDNTRSVAVAYYDYIELDGPRR